jgi:hypothetical protein
MEALMRRGKRLLVLGGLWLIAVLIVVPAFGAPDPDRNKNAILGYFMFTPRGAQQTACPQEEAASQPPSSSARASSCIQFRSRTRTRAREDYGVVVVTVVALVVVSDVVTVSV